MYSLDAASATNSANDFGAIVDEVLLPDASEKEEYDSDSHRESCLSQILLSLHTQSQSLTVRDQSVCGYISGD